MDVHPNITPLALCSSARRRVRCRAPCKVRLAPHWLKRALRARKNGGVASDARRVEGDAEAHALEATRPTQRSDEARSGGC